MKKQSKSLISINKTSILVTIIIVASMFLMTFMIIEKTTDKIDNSTIKDNQTVIIDKSVTINLNIEPPKIFK